MIKRSYYRSRKARLCFLGFSFGVVLLLASFVDVRYRNSILGKKQLRITRHANIPLREISGLAINRPDPGSEVRKLYAVGDRYARVASLDVNSASHELGPVHMVDLTSTIAKFYFVRGKLRF